MLANGIKETSSTTGTGTLTLTAVNGFARFSSAFAVGDRAAYCIKDGNNREWGVGTVGAGDTLERTFRLGTLVAGVYSSSLAGTLTPITLTSGAAEVICDVHDLLLPELGTNYLQVPPDPRRMTSPLPSGQHVKFAMPFGSGSISTFAVGCTISGQGTITARNITPTNLFTSSLRVGYVSGSTIGSNAGPRFHSTNGICHRGSGGGRGGFLVTLRFGISDDVLVSDAKTFAGLYASVATIPGGEPSAKDNIVGVCLDTTDTNLQVLTRGTVPTKIDLGAAFSRASMGNNANIITLTLWCPPSAGFIGYRVTMEGENPAEATGILTNNLPDPDALMSAYVWRNNSATLAPVGIDWLGTTMVIPQ